jgi:uncharacterized small protein (DUF1192 family)
MALNEPDEPRPPPRRVQPLLLDVLGVEELNAYIRELETEISRVRQEIVRKHRHREAAQAFFKTPGAAQP